MTTNEGITAKSTFADPGTLKPYERNSRKHSDDQVNLIAESIAKFGFLKPVLVDEDRMILAGHGATLAALQLELKRIPIRQIFGLTTDQKRAYVIADNRMSELSKWDWDLLSVELNELASIDGDLRPLGFEDFKTDKTTTRSQHTVTYGGDRFLLQLEFETEKEMQAMYEELEQRGIEAKILS